MSIFNEFNKKEKPVFTGSRFGFGSGGGASVPDLPPTTEVLFAEYNTNYTDSGVTTDSSSTKVLAPNIKYLYVLGTGGGGGGWYRTGYDTGAGGGGGGASIRRLVGYEIPSANQAQPIQVKTGRGGRAKTAGGDTDILINGSMVLRIGGGGVGEDGGPGGAGGTVSTPGLSRLPAFPSNFEAPGGGGGLGGIRDGRDGGNGSTGPQGGTGGGGGGSAHLNPKNAGSGASSSNSGSSVPFNFLQKNFEGSFPNPFPAVVTTHTGGGPAPNDGSGDSPGQRGGDVGLAHGGGGNGQDSNTGRSGGAGAGLGINTPNDPGTVHGGGGGGVRSQIGGSTAEPVIRASGGGGYIIVVGSSFELVSGVDY